MAVLLQQQRSRQTLTLLTGALLSCIVLLATSYFAWTSSSQGRPNKSQGGRSGGNEVLDTIQYPDVTEHLDLDTLQSLLLPAHTATSGQQQKHTWPQLSKLLEGVDAASLPGVTAILLYNDAIATQIQAVQAQQAVAPVAVWIICATEDERKAVVQRQDLPSTVEVMVRDRSSWLAVPPTDYVWLVDKGAVPGSRYLELVLKLAHTDEYRDTLLGSAAATLVQKGTDGSVECTPSAQQQTTATSTTHAAQTIHRTWLLQRHWLAALMMNDGAPAEQGAADGPILGYWISHSISAHAGASLMGLPAMPHADYRVDGDGADECKALEDYFQRHPSAAAALATQQVPVENQQQEQSVVFISSSSSNDSSDDEWLQLACDMHQRQDNHAAVHIVTTTTTTTSNDIERVCPSLPAWRVHPLSASSAELDASELVLQLMQIVRVTQARLVFYPRNQQQQQSATEHALEIAQSLLVDSSTTVVGLPSHSLQYTPWIAELPVDTLAKWHDFKLKIILTTEKSHAEPFMQLFESVNNAEYLGDRVDLMLFMESSTDARTQTTVQGVLWQHGVKDIRHRIVPTDRSSMFVEAWYPSTNNEYAIVLDDGMQVSPMFYAWAKYALLKYRYTPANQNKHLYGISLTAPRILDTADDERQAFDAPSPAETGSSGAYLMQVPPSLGAALYFPEHWREFHDYMNARVADHLDKQLQDIQVPGLRSSRWVHSWRRYMDELVYLRGNAMLYPNLPNGASFATRLRLSTDHAHPTPASMIRMYTVPLAKDAAAVFGTTHRLPEWSDLAALDMWGKPATVTVLADRGKELQRNVSACLPSEEYNFDPSELLCPFARVVVHKGGSDEPLPTRTITLYVPSATHL